MWRENYHSFTSFSWPSYLRFSWEYSTLGEKVTDFDSELFYHELIYQQCYEAFLLFNSITAMCAKYLFWLILGQQHTTVLCFTQHVVLMGISLEISLHVSYFNDRIWKIFWYNPPRHMT